MYEGLIVRCLKIGKVESKRKAKGAREVILKVTQGNRRYRTPYVVQRDDDDKGQGSEQLRLQKSD